MSQIKDYTAKTTPAGTDEYILQETGGGTTKKITYTNFLKDVTDDITAIQAQLGTSKSVASDYIILDDDGHDKFYIDPSGGVLTLTLPTLADNQDRTLKFMVSDLGGKVTIDGEGAETIGGHTELVMQSKNDHLELVGESGEWQIISYYARYETGGMNRSDWTDATIGTSAFDFDNRSAAFTIGELITETATGNTGILQSMTDAASGTIYVKNVTGTGIWTNNNQIIGSASGSTCDVNEAAGNNKNQDTDVFHNFGLPAEFLRMTVYIDDAATYSAAKYIFQGQDSYVNRSLCFIGVDSDNLEIQTGAYGVTYLDTIGNYTDIDTEDWSVKIIVEAKI